MVGPEDLDLLPFDALMLALARRFDTIVFGGVKHLGDGTTDYSIRHHGERFTAIGLALHAAMDLSRWTVDTERPSRDS